MGKCVKHEKWVYNYFFSILKVLASTLLCLLVRNNFDDQDKFEKNQVILLFSLKEKLEYSVHSTKILCASCNYKY
jgi:hypothetical protein